VRYGTIPAQPKAECEGKGDAVATDVACCLVDLGSADVSRRSTSGSEDGPTGEDDVNTGRYLPRFATPYIRPDQFPSSLKFDTNLSLSNFSGQHLDYLSTQ
jgi:hypothetical protein